MTVRTDEEALPALRANRDFKLLWTGAGVSFIGSRVSVIAYPMLVLWFTRSAADAGVVAFCANVPYILQLLVGGLVDRLDRRRMMIACDIGRLVMVGSLVIALAFGCFRLPHVAVVAFAETSLTILYRIAERAAVRHVVRAEDLPSALSRNEARERAASLLGQPVGSLLFALTRWAPFVFTMAANLVSLSTLLLIRRKFQEDRAKATGGVKAFVGELREGIVWAWRQPFVRVLAGLIAGGNMLFAALSLSLQYIVRDGGGSSSDIGFTIGLIFAVSGAGGTLGALTASWWMGRTSLAAIVIGCNAAWAVLIPQVAYVRNPVALGLLFAGMGYAGALWNVAAAVYQQQVTPDGMQGRVLSVATLVAFGAVPFGSLAGGILLDHFGACRTVLGLGAVMGILALTAAVSPAVRKLRLA